VKLQANINVCYKDPFHLKTFSAVFFAQMIK